MKTLVEFSFTPTWTSESMGRLFSLVYFLGTADKSCFSEETTEKYYNKIYFQKYDEVSEVYNVILQNHRLKTQFFMKCTKPQDFKTSISLSGEYTEYSILKCINVVSHV